MKDHFGKEKITIHYTILLDLIRIVQSSYQELSSSEGHNELDVEQF